MRSAAGSVFFYGPEQVGNKGSFLKDGRIFFFLFKKKKPSPPPKGPPHLPFLCTVLWLFSGGRTGSRSPPLVCAACCAETRRRSRRELSGAELAALLRLRARTKRGDTRGHAGDTRGTRITSHGSIRGSVLLLIPESISLPVGPSVLLGAERGESARWPGRRRSAVFARVCRRVCDSVCVCACVSVFVHHAEVFFSEKGEAR